MIESKSNMCMGSQIKQVWNWGATTTAHIALDDNDENIILGRIKQQTHRQKIVERGSAGERRVLLWSCALTPEHWAFELEGVRERKGEKDATHASSYLEH